MQFRAAAIHGRLELNIIDDTVSTLCEVVKRRVSKRSTAHMLFSSREAEHQNAVMDEFLQGSNSLPFASHFPLNTVSHISEVYTNDTNALIAQVPRFRNSSKLCLTHPGHADWQWAPLLFKYVCPWYFYVL